MSETEEQIPKEPEKTEAVQDILIEGCVSDKAREVIDHMLGRRLAELDADGLQAKFIVKLQNELNAMPTCKVLLGPKEEEKTES